MSRYAYVFEGTINLKYIKYRSTKSNRLRLHFRVNAYDVYKRCTRRLALNGNTVEIPEDAFTQAAYTTCEIWARNVGVVYFAEDEAKFRAISVMQTRRSAPPTAGENTARGHVQKERTFSFGVICRI